MRAFQFRSRFASWMDVYVSPTRATSVYVFDHARGNSREVAAGSPAFQLAIARTLDEQGERVMLLGGAS